MTYYEELGVAPTASLEEIRRAYRHLARVIHPDQCTDDDTRRLAELQMKRLNAMLAVLADQGSRADYDAALSGGSASSGRRNTIRALLGDRGRTGAAAVAASFLIGITLLVWPRRAPTPKPVIPPPQHT